MTLAPDLQMEGRAFFSVFAPQMGLRHILLRVYWASGLSPSLQRSIH